MPDAIDMAVQDQPGTGVGMQQFKETSQVPKFADGTLASELTPQNTTIRTETPQTQHASPLETPAQNEDLERDRRNMQADYTRKTQQLAEQRRQLEQERQMMQAIIAQQQQLAGLQAQPAAQQPSQQGVIRELLGPQWETMPPEAKAVWGTLDKATQVMQQNFDEKLRQIQQAQLNPQALGHVAAELIDVKTDLGINALRQAYGPEQVNAYAQDIKGLCRQYPGLTAEQALDNLNPQLKQNYLIEQGRKQALEEMKQQQQANVSNGRRLPSTAINDTYKLGESMRETVRRNFPGIPLE